MAATLHDMALRILHISTRLIQGGSQENTVLSCEGQAAMGHEVHLAYGPIYGPEGSYFDRANDYRGPNGERIGMHEVPHMVRQIAPVKDWRGMRELQRLIEDLRPDIVHTHSSKAGVIGRAAGWKVFRGRRDHRPAVVHTIHGPPFHRYLPGWKNRIYIASEKYAANRCHLIVSVADAMTRQFREAGIGREEQFVTVRSGMETEHFLNPIESETRDAMRDELGFSDDDFVIGTVARLAEHKGHDDILDGLGDELRKHPNWKLLWVGDGWWSERLLGRVAEMGLSDQVVTTGLVPQHRVGAMMRACDVLLHPSYREGLPRTVPQALLCGVPVVASDCDGTPEACIDPEVDEANSTGKLFKVGDTSGLRDAVVWMFEHPDERRAMGERGRAMCAQMFSTEAMVQGLEAVYARAIELAEGQ
ncbi:MAG: glycosyl transferase family 1 [Phycisphaerae bacterium]|nr:glycosyl transferase family 1 [Phycisphaerae bacterium]